MWRKKTPSGFFRPHISERFFKQCPGVSVRPLKGLLLLRFLARRHRKNDKVIVAKCFYYDFSHL